MLTLVIALAVNGGLSLGLPVPSIAGSESLTIPAPISNGSPSPLPWIHTTATGFADPQDQKVVLRGFVTTPPDVATSAQHYSAADYERMRSLGANYQSIRITLGALGYGRNGVPTAGYITQLRTMVTRAARQGIYSSFKLTDLDIPRFEWTVFWRDQEGEHAAYLQAWQQVWKAFAGTPAVIGYDLLNEPSPGILTLTPLRFETVDLNPFYRQAIIALRRLDPRHIVFFQPEVIQGTGPGAGPQPYLAPLRAGGLAYAPHFYPHHPRFSTRQYLPLMSRYLAEGRLSGAPVMIGEYGSPWNPHYDGDLTLERKFEKLETANYRLFARFGLSYSRPWFADDAVYEHKTTGPNVTWSVVQSRSNLDGPLRPWIVIPFENAAKRLLGDGTSS